VNLGLGPCEALSFAFLFLLSRTQATSRPSHSWTVKFLCSRYRSFETALPSTDSLAMYWIQLLQAVFNRENEEYYNGLENSKAYWLSADPIFVPAICYCTTCHASCCKTVEQCHLHLQLSNLMDFKDESTILNCDSKSQVVVSGQTFRLC